MRKMKKRIISLLLTFVMVVSLFAGMATPVEVKASTNSFYEPLILNSTTLNASTVWGSGDTEHVMDKDGGFYSSEKSSSGALPDNGEIVTSDGVPYQLAWTGNSPYAGNDSIRFEGKKSSSYVVSEPVTMKISTFGIYDKVYVLGTAGGFSDNTKSLNFKVTLTYTDGTSSETTYSLYDWYKDKSVVEIDGIGYKVFSRLNKDGKTIDKDFGKNGGPILQSKQIECDEEKILKDITFQIANTLSSVANDQGIYAAIYAVTGMVKSGAPASPVASVHSETSNSFTVSWKAVEGASSYAVDVSSYPTFQDASGEPSFVSGYMNKLETGTSAVIEGLAEGTTYYCRVRAIGEASAQSRSSEVVAATTKVVTSEDPEPTDSIDYAFDYAYDCQRSPAYPKKGDTVSLSEFEKPLGANETNGEWELIDCGKYDSSKHTEAKKETLANIVSSVANQYGTGNSEIKVYDLKKDGAHICYGVVCTVFDDGALFIGTTWPDGGGYYLCNTSLSFSDSFTEVAIGDTNNPVPANPEVHTHSLTLEPEKVATCTLAGNKAYYKCSGCDTLFTDENGTTTTTAEVVKIAELGHDMSKATCTEASKCKREGCAYTEETKLGHDMSKATCTEASKCKREGCDHTEGIKLGHDMSEATCTEASKCKREGCDYTEGIKLGHDMSKATCTEASKCQREGCDHTEGTALGHDWTGEWTIIKEATATEDGKKETLCIRGCGQKKVVIIPATGTTDDNGNLEKDAEVEPDAPIDEATLNNTKEELINAGNIFTDEEKTQITNGTDSRVWLEISKTDESAIASTDKAKMEQEATKIMGDNPTITYFDADLFKQVGSGAKQEISEPGLAMKITITIPDELLNRDKKVSREYKIIRLHEGQVDVIDGTFDVTTGEFTFETDKFSTYAIVYNEKNADIPVENVQIILPTNTTLTKSGETIQLNVNVLPSEATNKKVTWHSSNPAVATVDSNGKVTAISNGTVVITATSQSGSKSASVTLTVAIEPTVADEPKEAITPAQLEKNNLKINGKLKVEQKSNYIKATWGKVSNADGYKVYVQYCGKKFTKKPSKNLIGGKKNSVTIKKINGKKLNLKKNYKFYVVAYKIVDGKEVRLGKSIVAHVAGRNNTKYTNVKKIKVKKSKFTLKVNNTATIKASTILVKKGKRELTDAHTKEFRYATSDKDVAIVSKDGKIKAVGKGKCTIYVYARNGYCKKVSVTVK